MLRHRLRSLSSTVPGRWACVVMGFVVLACVGHVSLACVREMHLERPLGVVFTASPVDYVVMFNGRVQTSGIVNPTHGLQISCRTVQIGIEETLPVAALYEITYVRLYETRSATECTATQAADAAFQWLLQRGPADPGLRPFVDNARTQSMRITKRDWAATAWVGMRRFRYTTTAALIVIGGLVLLALALARRAFATYCEVRQLCKRCGYECASLDAPCPECGLRRQ